MTTFKAPTPELLPQLTTAEGSWLYRAGLVAEVIDDTGISDQLGFAARIIEGKYLTGLEEYIDDFRLRGFIGHTARPHNIPKNLQRDTSRLAERYVQSHERRLDQDLDDLVSLQQALPGLLYSVRIHANDGKPLPGTVEKIVGFAKETPFGSLIAHLQPVYAEEVRLLNPRLAVCDISQFDTEQQASLQPYMVESEA
jgi:hypothetical protein